jgi:hypothetical protein
MSNVKGVPMFWQTVSSSGRTFVCVCVCVCVGGGLVVREHL